MTALAFAPNGAQKSSLSNMIEEWFSNDSLRRGGLRTPSTNIIEHDDKYVIDLSVPGYSKDSFDINLERNKLNISTAESDQNTVENDTYRMREFSQKSFTKSFFLSDDIDLNSMSAKCDNGVLSVILPKKDEAKRLPPKSITIN